MHRETCAAHRFNPCSHNPDASIDEEHKPVSSKIVVHRTTPILNVSDLGTSFVWFGKWGWARGFCWGEPPSFGSVYAGNVEIFLCLDGQGGRGNSGVASTFGADGDDAADKGVWMSVWVDDVDAVYAACTEAGLDIVWPPTDMEWGVREMHLRHPDGHVFRVSRGIDAPD